MPASSWRKSADELLLADGPQTRDALIAHMMQLVPLGKALSMVKYRKRDECGRLNPAYESRRGDEQEIGSQLAARQTWHNAIRQGTWYVDEEGLTRHRDWQPGWAIPTLGDLDTATSIQGLSKWQWAAVVATYVVECEKHDNQHVVAKNSNHITASEFAALGFAGLQSKDTVRRYLRVWLDHSAGTRPKPGEHVVIPGIPWPSQRNAAESKAKRQPLSDADRALKSRDPVETATLLRRVIGDDDYLDQVIQALHDLRAKDGGNVVQLRRAKAVSA